nr:hypothetical protein [Tanacetum cinerariifolium]
IDDAEQLLRFDADHRPGHLVPEGKAEYRYGQNRNAQAGAPHGRRLKAEGDDRNDAEHIEVKVAVPAQHPGRNGCMHDDFGT